MHFINHQSRSRHAAERGSVLMIALLLVLLGTFGITAWFSLIAARSLEVSAKEEAMNRRVQLNGVKEIARQLGSQSFLAMDGGKSGNTEVQLGGTYGQVTTPPWSGTPYNNNSSLRYDQIGGIPGQSFSTDIVASLDDGHGALGALDYNLQLRTYVPALRGDLLTIHESANPATPITTNSNLLVTGRTVVWDGANALAHRTERLHTSAKASTVSLANLAGTAVLPDNETFAGRSTGNDFIGRLKKINASESSGNRYTSRLTALGFVTIPAGSTMGDLTVDGYAADVSVMGEPQISIDLDHNALPNLYIESHIIINLIGQGTAAELAAAGALPARLIVANNPSGSGTDRNLDLVLSGENNRPLVFAMSRGSVAHAHWLIVTYDALVSGGLSASFPTWRTIFEFENCPTVFDVNASGMSELHLRGGISTDATIDTASFPGVRMLQDTSPGLEAIASRAGFVEVYRN